MKDQYSTGGSKSNCSDWYASHDHMPPGPKTLRVTGKCKFPTAGYRVELTPANPQGINPKIYILDKIVHVPRPPVPQVETMVDVNYEEKTETEYDQIQIKPDDTFIDVEHPQ